MRLTRSSVAALSLALVTATVMAAGAHSLKELESQLDDREKYFQPTDKDAPGFELRRAAGRTVQLADFQDKVVVLHFIYTNCPDVCPLHADRIAQIQEMVNQTPMKEQVQFVSITTDPENDTADVLRSYGPAHGLDPVNWVFLTSGSDRPSETRELAGRYGHKFTKTGGGYQMHGVVTHVIDRAGRWRANFHGLEFNPTNLVLFVNALVNDVHNGHGNEEKSLWDTLWNLF